MAEIQRVAPASRPARGQSALCVMVVDMHPDNRALLKGALRGLEQVGSVVESSSVGNIMDVVAANPVDVMIIDAEWENEDVFQVVRRVKSDPRGTKLNFVLMSAALDVESRRKGMEVGISGYLPKPFDIGRLDAALRDAQGKVTTNHKDTLNKVRRIPFFSDFTDAELVRLLKICHTRKFAAGETVFHQGDYGDRLYLLLAGEVEIIKHRDGGSTERLTVHKAGEVFGEMAIVDSSPRSADARMLTDGMLIELNAEIINDINDILALKMFRKMAMLVTQKLREYTR